MKTLIIRRIVTGAQGTFGERIDQDIVQLQDRLS
jgi:hypothetical protein